MAAPALKFAQHQILVTERMSGIDVIKHALDQGAYHLLQKDGLAFDKEKKLAETMISQPKEFFANPMKSIMGGEDLQLDNYFSYQCTASTKKNKLIQYLEDFLHQHPKTKNVHDDVLLAADEIFTNASKNSGNFYESDASKPAVEGLIDFSAYVDKERVIIVCRDSFGRLVIPYLLDKISYCYDRGVAGAIQQGSGGAGIGSFLIFNNCSSYYIGVDPGKTTIVGVGFQYSPRSSDKSCLSKHLNFSLIE